MKQMTAFSSAVILAGGASATSVLLSDSNTSAGDTVNQAVILGNSSTIYVWVDVDPGQVITGLSLDIVSSAAAVLEATSYTTYNPTYSSDGDDTWIGINNGTVGDLLDDTNAIALDNITSSRGLDQSDIGTFTGTTDGNAFLVGALSFDATALGQTTVTPAVGSNNISEGAGFNAVNPTFVGGTIFVPGFIGDANLDGEVDFLDLSALAANFGTNAEWTGGNFNGDNTVDFLDLSALAANFGSSLSQAELESVGLGEFAEALGVPEPSSLALLGLGGLMVAHRRRG
ncbi:MAG: PEP-CTERM sorting domain-containing protein [Planctomycetota bacterium]